MAKKMKLQKMLGTALRVDEGTLARADALINYVGSLNASVVTRADVMRTALVRGLAALEREANKQ